MAGAAIRVDDLCRLMSATCFIIRAGTGRLCRILLLSAVCCLLSAERSMRCGDADSGEYDASRSDHAVSAGLPAS